MFIKRKRLIGAISGVLILAGLSVPAMAGSSPFEWCNGSVFFLG